VSALYWGRDGEAFGACYAELAEDVGGLEYQASLGDLCQNLLARRAEGLVVVLAPSCEEDLVVLQELRPMLLGLPVVVRLPSQEDTVTRWAHQLHPRFVAGGGLALSSVASIVGSLVRASQQKAGAGLGS